MVWPPRLQMIGRWWQNGQGSEDYKGWLENDSDEGLWCCENFINPMEQNVFIGKQKLLQMHRMGENLENEGRHKQAEPLPDLFQRPTVSSSTVAAIEKANPDG